MKKSRTYSQSRDSSSQAESDLSKTVTNAEKRRKLVKSVAATGGAVSAFAGGVWLKPVVNTVILPAHAQTSVNRVVMTVNLTTSNVIDSVLDAFIGTAHAGRLPEGVLPSEFCMDFEGSAIDTITLFGESYVPDNNNPPIVPVSGMPFSIVVSNVMGNGFPMVYIINATIMGDPTTAGSAITGDVSCSDNNTNTSDNMATFMGTIENGVCAMMDPS